MIGWWKLTALNHSFYFEMKSVHQHLLLFLFKLMSSSWISWEPRWFFYFIYFCHCSCFSGEGYPCKLLPGSADIISLAAVYGDFLIRSLINLVVNITIKLFFVPIWHVSCILVWNILKEQHVSSLLVVQHYAHQILWEKRENKISVRLYFILS